MCRPKKDTSKKELVYLHGIYSIQTSVLISSCNFDVKKYSLCIYVSPRFLCRPKTLYMFARAVGRQSAIYTENSWFASPALGRHISKCRGYRILLTIRNPYINRFTNLQIMLQIIWHAALISSHHAMRCCHHSVSIARSRV
jgi:hypothetical protein